MNSLFPNLFNISFKFDKDVEIKTNKFQITCETIGTILGRKTRKRNRNDFFFKLWLLYTVAEMLSYTFSRILYKNKIVFWKIYNSCGKVHPLVVLDVGDIVY